MVLVEEESDHLKEEHQTDDNLTRTIYETFEGHLGTMRGIP